MWAAAVPLSELVDRGRWIAELYCEEREAASAADPFSLAPVSSLATVRRGTIAPAARPEHVYRYIGLEHVASLTGDLLDPPMLPGRAILSRCKRFLAGDILFGRLRPYLNKVHLARMPGICSNEFYVLTPIKSRVTPHLLRALLSSQTVLSRVATMQTGSALPRLPLDELLRIEVRVPPPGQHRAFERFLAAREAEGRRLVRAAAEHPRETHAALLRALESGRPPTTG